MTAQEDKIHIIATGGTIDKEYNPSTQKNELRKESGIPDFLKKRISIDNTFDFEQVISVDSLDMTDGDRQKIVESILYSHCSKFIILHGTDTMIETAKFLNNKNLGDNNKIILTGAMIPLEGFYYSDAGFNLGYALGCLEQGNKGIYICMNGKTFPSNKVIKNIPLSRFEEQD